MDLCYGPQVAFITDDDVDLVTSTLHLMLNILVFKKWQGLQFLLVVVTGMLTLEYSWVIQVFKNQVDAKNFADAVTTNMVLKCQSSD